MLALLYFSYEYTGESTGPVRRWLRWLAILPLATCAWVFSDGIHHLARASAHIVADPPFGALTYDFSVIELASFVEVYLVGLYVCVRLLRSATKQSVLHRRQTLLVGASVLVALLGELPGILGYRWFGQRDSSPIWFAISGLSITFALTRYRLFDLVPIARDRVIENLPDPIFVVDAKNRLMDLNPAARALLGERAPKLGKDATQTFPRWLSQGLASTNAQQTTRQFRRSEGGESFEISEAELRNSDGGLLGHVLVLRDNTERRRVRELLREAHVALEARVAERTRELEDVNATLRQQIEETRAAQGAAQASERKFRAIFDGAYELIGMMTPEGVLLEANRTALSLVGAQHEDVQGKLFWDTPWWSHSAELRQQLRDAVSLAARGRFVRFDVTHQANPGELRMLDFSLAPILDDNGQVASLLAEGRDMTDLKRAEGENTRLQAELYQAQKLDSIGRLAGGVAHDFNNLLTVILGNIGLARMLETPSPRLHGHLSDIEQAALSAAALTRQLLAFARRQIVEPRVLNLNDSIENARKLLTRLLGEDIEVQLELETALWRVRVDPSHAEQMLVNLAVNARDAMPTGGRLLLRTENQHTVAPNQAAGAAPADYVVVSVSDQGIGMAPDLLRQIFEPFFTTKAQGLGTGLGLSMVYGAMQQACGALDVESVVGSGTTFRLHFPRCDDSAVDTLLVLDSRPLRGNETLALVEDQPLVRTSTKRQLESLGYRVLDFSTAEDALPALRYVQNLSLLIADVVLAGSSGRELAEHLSLGRPDLRVLFVSGYTEDIVLRHGIELGQVRFLAKPFSIAELAQAVRESLDSPPSARQLNEPDKALPGDISS